MAFEVMIKHYIRSEPSQTFSESSIHAILVLEKLPRFQIRDTTAWYPLSEILKSEELREKPVPVPLCLPQNPTWAWAKHLGTQQNESGALYIQT
jgi:hypothetical protein